MANYTMTIQQIVENDIDIFDFDFPLFREDFRQTFKQQFIDYFFFDEIGFETVARFKHNLKIKLELVMPYWNKMYESQELEQRILDNYSVVETFTKTITNVNNASSTANNTSENNTNVTNKNLYKDAPKTKVDIDQMDIVNSITKDINNSDSTTTNTTTVTNTDDSTNTENWTRKMDGNIGIQTDADAIIKWWESLRKVTQELFEKELSELFMGVY